MATYRLQFHAGFKFADAVAVIDYLDQLGVTDVYASPYLKARAGSEHGYDLCDHHQLNPELGTAEEYATLVAALREHDMRQIMDLVPNHMGIATHENAWWHDVLENGQSSPYAHYFDIDWKPIKAELENKVLLPMLGQQYGRVLESGELRLDLHDGTFVFRYYDNVFPLDPCTTIEVLAYRLDELRSELRPDSEELLEYESILTALEHLPRPNETDPDKVAERQREKEVVKRRLARLIDESPTIKAFVEANVAAFNGRPEDPHSVDRLDALLDAQPYRLSHWKAASDEINYRRFFDINELAALCMEESDVFQNSHQLVMELLLRGDVWGLRIDHVDGLYDPAEYLQRLQWSYLRWVAHGVYKQLAARAQVPGGVASSTAALSHRARAAGTETEGKEASSALATAGEAAFPAWEVIESECFEALRSEIGCPLPDLGPSPFEHDEGDSSNAAALPADETLSPGSHFVGDIVESSLPLYVVVEKILGADEPLPEDWPVAGTTGYDFLNSLGGLFVDPAGLQEIRKLYDRFIGERAEFGELAYQSKLLILRVAMSSELQMLAHRLNVISEQHRWSRDFTLNTLRHALREILACFPVYRTYIRAGEISDRDRRFVQMAVAQAKRRNPTIDASVFDFIRDTLLLEYPGSLSEPAQRQRELFVGRFQQITSPVMAKGIEDTVFYAYCPLVSLNEVGGEPQKGTTTIAEFQHTNIERLAQWPSSLNSTTSHDTKRSEDVRARISVLSEVPHLWRSALNRFARLNRRFIREVDGLPAPSRGDEYLFYQTMVGMWPLGDLTPEEHAEVIARLQAYMLKATHEAKQRTSWTNPNPEYDEAVRDFVGAVLEPRSGNRFLNEVREFHEKVVNWGLYSALSQVALKILSPGVPDIYQGQELWNFSLVDPDNRRPVDFDRRRWLLAELESKMQSGDDASREFARQLAASPRDDRLKLLVVWRSLQFRRQHPDLFVYGEYVPLEARGSRAEHVCAFAWRDAGRFDEKRRLALVVAPRFYAHLTPLDDGATGPTPPPIGSEVWGDTCLTIPELAGQRLRDHYTGRVHEIHGATIPLAELLEDFPVALLSGEI